MIVHKEYAQGSLEWIDAHRGVITASSLCEIVDSKFCLRTGDMPKTLLAGKVADAWSDVTRDVIPQTFLMEQGLILEQEAIPWFTLEYGIEIERVGFVTTDDGRIGCSPDGMLADGTGIEIKCPSAPTQVKYLLGGTLPKEYAAQVHGSMLVTDAPYWWFVSYRRRFPALVLKIHRDEKIIESMRAAITEWLAAYDTAWNKLIELNGGPPPKRKQFTPTPETPEDKLFAGFHDPDDIIP